MGPMTAAEYASLRGEAGLTQAELAELLGVHKMSISKRERGVRAIDREAEIALRAVIAERQVRTS